eukprot:TRINITY_DN4758_c0_g1_i3.p1 TRINITY_DN4758_c0_g1~~TRINITY_DN4758_c0_g1_i3.p1  ORF type:complete len:513 (+),score=204.35 TRINITY_DN4758_c0_g1_i3:102-1541(+)
MAAAEGNLHSDRTAQLLAKLRDCERNELRRRLADAEAGAGEKSQEITQLREKLQDAEGARDRALAEGTLAAERHAQVVSVLRGELEQERQGRLETDRRLTAELTALRAEHDKLRWQHAQAEGQLKSSDRDSFDKIAALTHEGDLLREQLAQAQAQHQEAMAVRERQEAAVAAERDTAQRRAAELQLELEKCEQRIKDTTILSWHEREQFKQLAQQRGGEIEALKARLAEQQVASETELSVVRRREHEARVTQRAELLGAEDELRRTREELNGVSLAAQRAEESLKSTTEAATAKEGELTQRVQELEGKCAEHEATIQTMERQLVAQYDARALAHQNEELKATVQMYKNQIASLNHTVAALRVEADIVDNHAVRELQVANTSCVARITELEHRAERQERLLAQCVPIAEESVGCPPGLRKECAAWRRERTLSDADQGGPRELRVPLPPPHNAAAARPADSAQERPDVRSRQRASASGLPA